MTFADRMLDDLGPSFATLAGPLLPGMLDALTGPVDDVDALLQPAPGGWATFADLDTTPQPWWFGQVVGVEVDRNLSLEQQRAAIRSRPNALRGTPAAMVAAVQTLLTGTQTVRMTERAGGDAYACHLTVYEGELIDPATTTDDIVAAATSQKPVGIILTATIAEGATFAQVATNFATLADVKTGFSTFDDLSHYIP